ncbi:hypothetical protein NPIL_416411 [Nephila pilipes]|uniref:Uncharacterized protein n=1 Tax=Nephila pilipes TaxID=299642 RepID=A0A8X6IUY0_NEPPI|nr:hypothetical protein NPIL_416411 [Nephila pilipes]
MPADARQHRRSMTNSQTSRQQLGPPMRGLKTATDPQSISCVLAYLILPPEGALISVQLLYTDETPQTLSSTHCERIKVNSLFRSRGLPTTAPGTFASRFRLGQSPLRPAWGDLSSQIHMGDA